MTSRTETRLPQADRIRWLVHSDLVTLVAAAILAWGVGLVVLDTPAVVPSVSIKNASDYNIGVKVSRSDGGWIGLGTAPKQSTTSVHEVIDQGDEWVFHFASQGRQAGELRVDRADLESAQWRIEIPNSAVQTLRDSGAPLPP